MTTVSPRFIDGDPPRPTRGGTGTRLEDTYRPVIETLASRRGEWAVVVESDDRDEFNRIRHVGRHIKEGAERLGYEAEYAQRTIDGAMRMYVRVLGKAS